MKRFIGQVRYGLLAVGFTLWSTLTLFASAELTQEELDGKNFQLHGVALFSGTDPFSVGIKIATDSHYSHVGILLCDASEDKSDPSSWYCFESTGGVEEILNGVFPHARVTRWYDVVKQYPGGVARRLLLSEKDPDIETVTEFIRKYNGRAYEKDMGELLKSFNDGNDKPNMKTVFCSELTAALMQKLGIIDSAIPSNNYLPSEFSVYKENLPFRAGYSLGGEEVIKKYELKRITRFGLWFRGNVVEKLFSCMHDQGDPA